MKKKMHIGDSRVVYVPYATVQRKAKWSGKGRACFFFFLAGALVFISVSIS